MAEETMRCLKPVCYTKLSIPRRMRLDVCEHNVWAKNRKAIGSTSRLTASEVLRC